MPLRNTFAALVCAGVVLGAGLSATVPTEVRTQPNSQLEQLSQVRLVSYPNEAQVVNGPNSYPIVYSPQWLAVAEQAERQRMARWALPEVPPPAGYEQPSFEQDMAVQRQGVPETAENQVQGEPAQQEPAPELAEADAPAA